MHTLLDFIKKYVRKTVLPFIMLSLSLFLAGCTEPLIKSSEARHNMPSAKYSEPSLHSKLSGRWVNQRGSILEIREGHDRTLTGTFTTAVAKTESCIGYPASFTGYRNGNAIALSLTMEGCQSPVVIAMAGSVHYNAEGKEEINMLGLTQYQGKELWNARIITTDFYRRMEQ